MLIQIVMSIILLCLAIRITEEAHRTNKLEKEIKELKNRIGNNENE